MVMLKLSAFINDQSGQLNDWDQQKSAAKMLELANSKTFKADQPAGLVTLEQ